MDERSLIAGIRHGAVAFRYLNNEAAAEDVVPTPPDQFLFLFLVNFKPISRNAVWRSNLPPQPVDES